MASERRLHDATRKGDLASLRQVFQQDPYLLEATSFPFSRTLLHIAITHGHITIVDEVLEINPRLARILDSQKLSPLHIAVEEGNLEIVKRLVLVAPETCWWRDSHDMNPIHAAAMAGRVEILDELIQVDPSPGLERLHRGQTVLHLCVKHGQLSALKVLVERLGELVCAKDDDGETLLHLGVRCNQLEMIRYLLRTTKLDKETTNAMGKTALDILKESPRDPITYGEMKRSLSSLSDHSTLLGILPKMTDITMVVVVLIATMAFQAAISPPGGVWQENTASHRAGQAVMASTHPKMYRHFVNANTTAFVSALVTIMLITTGLPLEQFFFLVVATTAMWLSLTSLGVGYGASLIMTTPNEEQSLGYIVASVVSVFFFFVMLLLLYLSINGLRSSLRRRSTEGSL
ncbi:ankyrin repeat-containing protein At5g02620-like [Salvia hispanica]|uniref:ankyrin repeat-containing protein At5g02620-like n=1 Tax=Salvia hispanica TaxID=49212 RepID=UPI0020090EEA|nr:ankyrin repeat-containing protein At5g02620-like [Salvia hispanica]